MMKCVYPDGREFFGSPQEFHEAGLLGEKTKVARTVTAVPVDKTSQVVERVKNYSLQLVQGRILDELYTRTRAATAAQIQSTLGKSVRVSSRISELTQARAIEVVNKNEPRTYRITDFGRSLVTEATRNGKYRNG